MTAEALDTRTSSDVLDPTAAVDDCELFLASPTATVVARDVIAADHATPLAEAARRGIGLLADCAQDLTARERASGGPLLVGAVPFAPGAPARLAVARDVGWGPPVDRTGFGPAPEAPKVARVDLLPWPARYMAGVERAVARIAGLSQHKVVLARAIDVITAEPARVRDVVRSLLLGEPDAYVFAVPVDNPRPGPQPAGSVRSGQHQAGSLRDEPRRVLVGASPELVVRRIGRSVVSNPLAGSAPRSADPVEDRRRAWELQRSAKDLLEHRIVVDAVAEALRPYCDTLDVPERPSVIHTSRMWHLSTRVRGVLADPLPNALELAAALHPTPAVCGWPTAFARRVIAESETFDRRYYTGLTGWMNESGDGEWVLALRCAEVAGTQLRLYAGAGVVEGSDPASELAETSAKFRTFLSALGIEDAVAMDLSGEVAYR